MSTIILEMGSGNTCRNEIPRVYDMISTVAYVDTGLHEVMFKWQLFSDVPPNVPLEKGVFDYAYNVARDMGYKTSASVFDERWRDWLLENYDVPFVKIACMPEIHDLALGVPQHIRVYMSYPEYPEVAPVNVYPLCGVRKYPATRDDYLKTFTADELKCGISDHSPGLGLYQKIKPHVWEKHVVDVREAGNPDAGPFAITIDELMGVL